jgi:Flp pilus assembly pilin Flp
MSWLQLMCQRGPFSVLTGRLVELVRGQSTVEYALVGALVVIAAAAALTALGDQVNTVFGNISTTLRTAASH